jgi:RNA polymerase sigma-70 factor, ECF subfamily
LGADEATRGAWEAFYLRARSAWPGIELSDEVFAAFTTERLVGADAEADALRRLAAEDLYLVCACLQGSERAARKFRAYVQRDVDDAVRRIDPAAADDVAQNVFRRLFLTEGDRPPKIAHYQGKGDIRRWVRVVATRLAIDARRQHRSETPLHEHLLERLPDEGDGAELEHLQRTYRRAFKDAFAAAVGELTDRQRNVLRYHVDGLTADQIGRMYNVHRVTVARWLSAIRGALLHGTRGTLRARLDVEHVDVDSIMRIVDGEVTLSIDRLLGG